MSLTESTISTAAPKDRFIIWPIALARGFPLLLGGLWAGPFVVAFFGAPILILLWIVSALFASSVGIFEAMHRRWRRALSASILPVVTLLAVLNYETVWLLAIEAGERIHFKLTRQSYLQEISKLPSSGEPRFKLWMWGGFVVGHALVYDESDELPNPEHSQAWKSRVAQTEVGACGAWGTPLGDHFYLVRTGC
jgi:hypothetical protein